MSIKLQGNVQFSKHDFPPQKSPNVYKIGSYQEDVKFIVFLFCFTMCTSDLWNSKDGFQLCIHTNNSSTGQCVGDRRDIRNWLLSEVPAWRQARIARVAEMLLDGKF